MPSGVRADDAVLGAQLSCRSETSVHVMSVQSSVTTAEEAQCEARINTYLRSGDTNDADEVHTLQMFLRDIEGMDLEVTDVFDEATERAVNEFQIRYKEEILMPWGISEPTGYVYYTTQRKINEISCNGGSASLTGEQLAEIVAYRKLVDTYPDVDTTIVGLEDSDDDGALALTDDDGEGATAAVSSALKGLEVSNTVKFLGFLVFLIIFVTLVTNHRKMQNSLAKNEWVSKLKNRVK